MKKADHLSNSQLAAVIDEWIRGERNRKIMKRRMIDDIKYQDLAEEFDLSIQQTKAIVQQGFDRLIPHL